MKSEKSAQKAEKRIIGRTDIGDFPDLGLTDVRVKVDTGAYTSAIHCYNVKLIDEQLVFDLPAHKGKKRKRFVAKTFELKSIKNSFGKTEMRYVIRTRIVLFGQVFQTEFSLADREQMRYPVLLGRKLLRNRFLVDVSLENLSYQQK
ncbi:ATP-dependent zinc protease family protein [Runella slithyformis]|uniref:Retropepsin-like aspartic endopeptidase domain-containing protein n=1 Tax=Runella slithyformis (strain ATCC 29530 / DSM 19594 / LMG 11500 / NCIMB 11436 / LSU 4) TaxID=761193 RepID=A0A7U3ZMK8_RUNSL|nr:RimK/LysX family protein [Runella slithyformis]AEI49984.1 protein of unknown function DUF785 [Runella slithyformis DSM 19594]